MTTRDPGRWMWAEACQMLEQAERLHRQYFELAAARSPGPAWQPPADVLEDDRHLMVTVALPGVPPDAIEVRREGGALVVSARRSPARELAGAAVRRLEIPYGHFERRFELPLERLELVRQVAAHGCLHLLLRKH